MVLIYQLLKATMIMDLICIKHNKNSINTRTKIFRYITEKSDQWGIYFWLWALLISGKMCLILAKATNSQDLVVYNANKLTCILAL